MFCHRKLVVIVNPHAGLEIEEENQESHGNYFCPFVVSILSLIVAFGLLLASLVIFGVYVNDVKLSCAGSDSCRICAGHRVKCIAILVCGSGGTVLLLLRALWICWT